MTNCPPPEPIGAQYMTPCEIYDGLNTAYLALLSGSGRIRVRFNERETWFARTDIVALRAEVDRYAAACAATDPTRAAEIYALRNAAPRFGNVCIRPFEQYRRRYSPFY